MKDSNHPGDRVELVQFKCACGQTWRQRTRHYEVIQCQCRRRVWSLRPKRGGPLVGFQHPGTWQGMAQVWVNAD